MVRKPSFDSNGIKKGAWSEEEDSKLRAYFQKYDHVPNWRFLPLVAGLARSGKSCRLRWVNYLKPGLKLGKFDKYETDLIIQLHAKLGNKWSAIAAKLPGRSDSEIKNYWHGHIKKSIGQNGADQRLMPEKQSDEIKNKICKAEDIESKNVGLLVESPQIGFSDFNSSIEDSYSAADPQGYDLFSEVSETYFSELPVLEEFHYSGLISQEMDTSDSGISTTFWYSTTADQSVLEQDTFDIVLWQ